MKIFDGFWAMPEYAKYVVLNFGPAGSYLGSCRACKMVKRPWADSNLQCECRGPWVDGTETEPGHAGLWVESEVSNPHDCARAGFEITNEVGYLKP